MSASIPQDPIYSSPKQTVSNKNLAAIVALKFRQLFIAEGALYSN